MYIFQKETQAFQNSSVAKEKRVDYFPYPQGQDLDSSIIIITIMSEDRSCQGGKHSQGALDHRLGQYWWWWKRCETAWANRKRQNEISQVLAMQSDVGTPAYIVQIMQRWKDIEGRLILAICRSPFSCRKNWYNLQAIACRGICQKLSSWKLCYRWSYNEGLGKLSYCLLVTCDGKITPARDVCL